jgi:3-oxoadipate enol-lactonase / 4-carboxymuconolactone decarboxylase
MAFATTNGVKTYYRLEGDASLPTIALAHSIGVDHGQWAPQMPDLLEHFRVLRYDIRGHGASEAPPGDYSMEMLGRDFLALADAVGISKLAFCGLSLGGMIGQWLGINASERLSALVLANTSPVLAPKSNWDERRKTVLQGGMAAVADAVMQRFFSPELLASKNPYAATTRATILATAPVGYAGCCAAIRDMDHTALLKKISAPTLVIGSESDVSTPWNGHGEILAREIPGAKASRIETAHLSNINQPRAFTAAVIEFCLTHAGDKGASDGQDPYDAGMTVRRAVLGDAHVDRSLANATEVNRDFQELITRYAWGSIWTRPGLDRRTRRLLVLAMMASLGRWEEFRMHVRAALDHGMEPCDVKELLLQAAIYAGVPAANTAFHIAIEEIDKIEKSKGQKSGAGSA